MINLLLKDDLELDRPVLYRAKLHWTSYIFPMLCIVIGALGIIPLFIFKGTFQIISIVLVFFFCKGVYAIIKKKSVKIYLTQGYLSISSGVLSKSVVDISLKKMEGMHLYQNWIGKIFDMGTIMVSTGGIIQKYSIADPMELRKEIMEQI